MSYLICKFQKACLGVYVFILLLFTGQIAFAACPDPIILHGDIVTMQDRASVFKGDVLVCSQTIQEIKKEDESWTTNFDSSNVRRIELGYIFPGLINLHDHSAYNFLPLWDPPKRYDNRYKWASAASYRTDVKDPYKLLTGSKYYNMMVDVARYDEIKSIVGGTTATQGSPIRSALNGWLIRNVDMKNFGIDKVYSRTLTIDDSRFNATRLISNSQVGKVDTWFIHLAEGVDEKSRNEFDTLKDLNLLQEWTAIIHGTALGKNEFAQIGQAGAKLVWSPTSNLLLYGTTTRVDYAKAENITISLATDWSPSGCKNLLDEIKVAWEINKQYEDLPDYEPFDTFYLAQMVTVNPAKTLNWQDLVGQLKSGYYADIMAFAKPAVSSSTPELNPNNNPYDALVRATTKDIQLVMVGGDPVYGDVVVMDRLKGNNKEIITITGNIQKAIDVSKPGETIGYHDLIDKLNTALRFDPDHMYEKFKIVSDNDWSKDEFNHWLLEEYSHVKAMPVDPVFVLDDPVFFSRLATVEHSNILFDLKDLYYTQMDKTLLMVNHPLTDATYLREVVGISSRSANNIESFKAGTDRRLNTNDDQSFLSIEQLDMVKYVGPVTLKRIQTFAANWQAGQAIEVINPVANFLNQESTTFVLLDITVGLRRDAAANIINRRNGEDGIYGTNDDKLFTSIDDVMSVNRVGESAVGKIESYVLNM